MNIKDAVEETGYSVRKKSSTQGGEYSSPCPFCKDGDDRLIIQPYRAGWEGGKFSCRVCGRFGDAIKFLMLLHGMGYKDACAKLRIEPKQRDNSILPRPVSKPLAAEEPSDIWKEKAKFFAEWSHKQLLRNNAGLTLFRVRGFIDESIVRFQLGFNPRTFFRERDDWGLTPQLKEDGKTPRKLWLPAGIVIPTVADGKVIKVKIRRHDWKEGDQWPKYIEISGSKQTPSIYGDTSLSIALVLESELDALLVQQEAADLLYCIALGGVTKRPGNVLNSLLKNTSLILFSLDFDEPGKNAYAFWRSSYSNLKAWPVPETKSPGDAFLQGINLREWLSEGIEHYGQLAHTKKFKDQ